MHAWAVLACLPAVAAVGLHTAPSGPADVVTTLVGPPEVVGGPTCCLFDSPFLALRTTDAAGPAIGLTANAATFVVSRGANVSVALPSPAPTGLAADASNSSYSHCGKWLNGAFVDPANASIVHGYYHQEWRCDYADGLYTNKSIGYARSDDGGLTFAAAAGPHPGDGQLVAAPNSTTAHQTGEGDHGVVRLGDYLYMLFLEWDGPASVHGGTTVGLARSAVADRGRPGTWFKWWNGGFTEPAVGGRSDLVWAPGTAVYAVPDAGGADVAVAIGVIFSAPLEVAWTGGGAGRPLVDWAPARAGPLFTAGWSSWDRNANSSELFGYPSLAQAGGSPDATLRPAGGAYVYVTYLAPGRDFTSRWLVRRPLVLAQAAAGAGGAFPPPALAALSVWTSPARARVWATAGPVTPDTPGNFTVAPAHGGAPSVAFLATAAPPPPAPALVAVLECGLSPGVSALAADGECGRAGGALARGAVLRTAGWVAATSADAAALGWGDVTVVGGGPATAFSLAPVALWRCVGAGAYNFSASVGGGPACAGGAGFVRDVLLGYALAPSAAGAAPPQLFAKTTADSSSRSL